MPHNIKFLAPEPINLVNNESSSEELMTPSLHFRDIRVGNCTIVNSQNNKFTVWQIEVTLAPTGISGRSSPKIHIYKRYTEFEAFREKMMQTLSADLRPNVPPLPPKLSWYDAWRYEDANFKSGWLARRRAGLELFLNTLLLNDKILLEGVECIKEFLKK
ncbi:LANO_0H22804g1_1 [Lachancea nothofagi CBS 11611]|uniref:Sorting nexin-3 n=1 Tax=Lachancea nothofagi CBS 11611 TaxID=1266666 RepID=A0A1G4KNS8_9SACH|nr:LANO_0H22804g1_1 [Lachancea nothofagi CBS 11611]